MRCAIEVPLTHKRANQHLLARLLRRKAEILEIPVQFFPISPERVKRTRVLEGLQSLATLVADVCRGRPCRRVAAPVASRVSDARRAAEHSCTTR